MTLQTSRLQQTHSFIYFGAINGGKFNFHEIIIPMCIKNIIFQYFNFHIRGRNSNNNNNNNLKHNKRHNFSLKSNIKKLLCLLFVCCWCFSFVLFFLLCFPAWIFGLWYFEAFVQIASNNIIYLIKSLHLFYLYLLYRDYSFMYVS